MKPLRKLAESWLRDAEILERYRDDRGAELCRLHATELEEAIRDHDREALTLSQAAEVSGYSVDHLRHLVADGTLPNAGRHGAPAILRRDVPIKPGSSRSKPVIGDADSEAEAILRDLEAA